MTRIIKQRVGTVSRAQSKSNSTKRRAKLNFARKMLPHIRAARHDIRTGGMEDTDSAVARWLNDYNVCRPDSPIKTARGNTTWTAQQVGDVCSPEPTARDMGESFEQMADRAAALYIRMMGVHSAPVEPDALDRVRAKYLDGKQQVLAEAASLGRRLRLEE